MAQIIWSPRALEDLAGILDYIERDSAFYARLFGEKLLDIIEFAAKNPLLGAVVQEYNISSLRERILQNYRIVYRVQGDQIELVTICHAARVLRIESD